MQPPILFRRSFDERRYVENLKFNGDMAEFVARVAAYAPRFILAGSELGVNLTEDLLAHFPQLPQNDARVPQARRNKYLMAECVKQHGLEIIPQIQTASADDAARWAQQRDEWPVIVKDVLGSGSCGVRICSSTQEIKEAFRDLLGSQNDLNIQVRNLVV